MPNSQGTLKIRRNDEWLLKFAELRETFKVRQIGEGPIKYAELMRDL